MRINNKLSAYTFITIPLLHIIKIQILSSYRDYDFYILVIGNL